MLVSELIEKLSTLPLDHDIKDFYIDVNNNTADLDLNASDHAINSLFTGEQVMSAALSTLRYFGEFGNDPVTEIMLTRKDDIGDAFSAILYDQEARRRCKEIEIKILFLMMDYHKFW